VGVRRETASSYLKDSGVLVRPPGGWGWPPAAEPTVEVTTDPGCAKPALKVITDSGAHTEIGAPTTSEPHPGRSRSAGAACGRAAMVATSVSFEAMGTASPNHRLEVSTPVKEE